VRISEFLRRENILFSFKSDEKGAAVRELCALLAQNGDVTDAGAVFDAVMKRENLSSTGIGDEVGIPHARTSSAKAMTSALGLSRNGIEYFAMDDKPVKLVFMLVAGGNCAGNHLKALARISRLIRSPGFRKKIELANSADEMYSMIAEEDVKLG
jgi:PTS system nitrogen regulatory IIA component